MVRSDGGNLQPGGRPTCKIGLEASRKCRLAPRPSGCHSGYALLLLGVFLFLFLFLILGLFVLVRFRLHYFVLLLDLSTRFSSTGPGGLARRISGCLPGISRLLVLW